MNPQTPYQPIDCAIHDVLESLATLRRGCTIVYRDRTRASVSVEATIVDVYAEDGAEYLRTGEGAVVRLDELVSVDGIPVRPAC